MRTSAAGDVRSAIAVISPARGDGRSFDMAANLAVVLAQLGGRTLLDANLRAPAPAHHVRLAWAAPPGSRACCWAAPRKARSSPWKACPACS